MTIDECIHGRLFRELKRLELQTRDDPITFARVVFFRHPETDLQCT